MEKFAVDLDKVLDDFEFNEDCAEQIASVSCPSSNIGAASNKNVTGSSISTNYNPNTIELTRKNKNFNIASPFDKPTDGQVDADNISSLMDREITKENVDYHSRESIENTDSVNHYYPREYISDEKITQKQNIQSQESEQASLTIYNDISSQKLLQKQQNGSGTKIQNTYDKKLNQPNIKPSVSNVFSSLNEYINAPTVNVNYVDAVLEERVSRSNKQVTDIVRDIADTSERDGVLKDNLVKDALTNYKINVHEETTEANASSSNFQNVPSISMAEPFVDNNTNDKKECNPERIPQLNTTGTEASSTKIIIADKTTAEEISHVYEGTCTSTNALQNDKLSVAINQTDVNEKQVENVNINKGQDLEFHESDKSIHQNTYIEIQENSSKSIPDSAGIDTEITEASCVPIDNENSIKEEQKSHNFPMQISESQAGPCFSLSTENHKSKVVVPDQPRKPIGFSNIDNLSEEELKRYLAELEEEEGISEEVIPYQNTELSKCQTKVDGDSQNTFQCQRSNEDINELPYENVVSLDLPILSAASFQSQEISTNEQDKSTSDSTSVDLLPGESFKTLQDSSNIRFMKDENKSEQSMIPESYNTSLSDFDVLIQSQDQKIQDRTFPKSKDKIENIENIEHLHSQNLNLLQDTSESKIESETKEESEYNKFDQAQNIEQVTNEKYTSNITHDIQSGSLVSYDNTTVNTQEFAPETIAKFAEPSPENDRKQNENLEAEKPVRPQTLDIQLPPGMDHHQMSPGDTPGAPERSSTDGIESHYQEPSPDISDNSLTEPNIILGKQPPFWIPDSDAPSCMLCDMKFTVLKRRHHCRACGKVLCNKCCNMKFRLEYQGNIDSRVCVSCYQLLVKAESEQGMGDWSSNYAGNASSSEINSPQGRQPNPNNPMEYCSTIPPLQQLAGGLPPPPTVMVPVGVLKREGSTKQRSEGPKSVMFSDELDTSWDLKPPYRKCSGGKRVTTPGQQQTGNVKRHNLPPLDNNTNSYIPQDPNSLPPTVTIHKGQVSYHNVTDQNILYKSLKNECEPPIMFAINRNLYAYVKITNLNCCVNKICWNVTSKGLACVGQDEVILLVETLPDETQVPKDLLLCINQIYLEALKGNTVTELGFSIFQGGNLLGSREHAGFLFIRQTLQCLQKIVLPPAPFLVGLLVHRWETPWAKVFPLRLLLRLGAEYRYYPCPLVSVRFRNALYFEIGHTVMKVLADFRNFGYTLPSVRGLTIHLKNRTTDVMFPRNRYDQVIKGLNNSNDHVLAYASNFSITADSHLVCIQTNSGDESSYQTQAINIHNKPRTVTAVSFIVINGALKSSMGLSAKSSIVEDGLMVEIMPEKMEALKAALKNMLDFSIGCGKLGAAEPDETVNIVWVDNDTQFNLGVKSPIDGQLMDGIPSIRVHNGVDYKGTSRIIRWTEVFIIKSDDHPNGVHDPVDINKLSENIARATCTALVKLLDLLATAGLTKLGVRTTIHPDNVGYEAGSEGTKLPPIYMNSLDNELIQVLHKAAQSSQDTHTVLELIFYILDD